MSHKDLIGVSPSGSVTFVSELYDGSISDKEIERKSGICKGTLVFWGQCYGGPWFHHRK